MQLLYVGIKTDEEAHLTDFKLDAHATRIVGHPLSSEKPQGENPGSGGYIERLEWVRKSYERFLAKLVENEALVAAPPADIG